VVLPIVVFVKPQVSTPLFVTSAHVSGHFRDSVYARDDVKQSDWLSLHSAGCAQPSNLADAWWRRWPDSWYDRRSAATPTSMYPTITNTPPHLYLGHDLFIPPLVVSHLTLMGLGISEDLAIGGDEFVGLNVFECLKEMATDG
jgi:predicted membrane-bound mannosyltransferase